MKKANENIEQVKRVVNQVKIMDDRAYMVKQQKYEVYHQQPYQAYGAALNTFGKNEGMAGPPQRQQLLQHLVSTLYSVAYCQMPQEEAGATLHLPESNQDFVQKLSAANGSTSGLDMNWQVYSVNESGNAFVEKNGEVRLLPSQGFQFANPANQQLQVGTYVQIVRQKESTTLQPSFYYVYGNVTIPQETELVRFYWNLKSEGMPLLIAQLTSWLNQYKIPFSFKCLNHPKYYKRADNAVLYIAKKSTSIVNLLLPKVFDQITPYFNQEVPLFTKKIRDGVAFAEDPGNNESFGMHRSRVLAEGLLKAYDQKWKKPEKVLSVVLEHFKSAGLNPEHLYLNPHSHFFYNFSRLN